MPPWVLLVSRACRMAVPTLQVSSAWLCMCSRIPSRENCEAGGLKSSCHHCLSMTLSRGKKAAEASSQLQL